MGSKCGRTYVGCLNEYGSVGDDRVNDNLGADSLMLGVDTALLDVEADAAVVDVDSLVGPSPAPVGVDTGLSIVNREIPNYKRRQGSTLQSMEQGTKDVAYQ